MGKKGTNNATTIAVTTNPAATGFVVISHDIAYWV